MPKRKVSKYEAKLRELGFKPYSELLSQEDFAETEDYRTVGLGLLTQGLNRKQRRQARAMIKQPQFAAFDDYTFAIDETGTDWGVTKIVDLSSFGFIDILKEIRQKDRNLN